MCESTTNAQHTHTHTHNPKTSPQTQQIWSYSTHTHTHTHLEHLFKHSKLGLTAHTHTHTHLEHLFRHSKLGLKVLELLGHRRELALVLMARHHLLPQLRAQVVHLLKTHAYIYTRTQRE